MRAPRIAIVGLGNLMRTDDALGMLALSRLKMDFQLSDAIAMIEGGTLGLELMQPLENVTHLLALDAIDAGETAGTLLRFAGDQIADMPASKSVHLLGFSDLIGAMTLTGDAPEEIVVLGLQPELIAWGTRLTNTVEAALPRLIDAALEQIAHWTRELAEPAVCCEASWS
jgi:hydrogenase maturation protease